MKNPTEWNDEPELFNDIVNALDQYRQSFYATDEEGEYGEKGYIDIRTEDGRKFRLDLHEII